MKQLEKRRGRCGFTANITKKLFNMSNNQQGLVFWIVCVPIRVFVLPFIFCRMDFVLLQNPVIWAFFAYFISYRFQEVDWKERKLSEKPKNRRPFLFEPLSYTFHCDIYAPRSQLALFFSIVFIMCSTSNHIVHFRGLLTMWTLSDTCLGIHSRYH